MKRNLLSSEITAFILRDCYRMARHPELRRYVGDVLILLIDSKPRPKHVEPLTRLGNELLALSWRWHSEFAPRDYNVQMNVLKATIFALEDEVLSMAEQWQMAHYVAHGEAGKRIAARVAGDMLKRATRTGCIDPWSVTGISASAGLHRD